MHGTSPHGAADSAQQAKYAFRGNDWPSFRQVWPSSENDRNSIHCSHEKSLRWREASKVEEWHGGDIASISSLQEKLAPHPGKLSDNSPSQAAKHSYPCKREDDGVQSATVRSWAHQHFPKTLRQFRSWFPVGHLRGSGVLMRGLKMRGISCQGLRGALLGTLKPQRRPLSTSSSAYPTLRDPAPRN